MNRPLTEQAFQDSAILSGATAARGKRLFLLTPSEESCAVEIFTRSLVGALQERYPDEGYELLPISGRWRDLPAVLGKILKADQVVFNLPLVAWKRLLLTPLLILLVSSLARRPVSVFMHEWSGLHWLRRLALAPIVMLSRTIIVVSPFIAEQIANSRWLIGAGAKYRLVPHPPTIRIPHERRVTERIRQLREATGNCDVVIGCFGSIYRGKAATALLDICKHLQGRGIRAAIVFIGSFTKSLDGYEHEFRSKVSELGIGDQVIVTGYIPSEIELYTLFEEIGAFLFLFPEGLTARRSSVIACLHSDRPVVVTAPRSAAEFAHHEGFTKLIGNGALSFIPADADLRAIADRLLTVAQQGKRVTPVIDDDAWWNAAMNAVRAAF
jgi:glycosyltransferase involved in cell wall biosynthesis